MAAIYDAIKASGWGVVYYATIEGLPVVWTERALSLSLPSGYTSESATLIVEDSDEVGQVVDRETGLGVGLPLTLTLLDSDTLRTYLQAGHATHLTADLTGTATTATVADTSALAASGSVWIGAERVEYTGKTATTLTGLTRAGNGYAYPHRAGTTVSDAPRRWSGREVRLYARPITPSGYAPGTALADNAVEVWRGRIRNPPQRNGDGWAFDALALDRVLGEPLPSVISGRVAHNPDPGAALVQMTSEMQSRVYTLAFALLNSSGSVIGEDVSAVTPFDDLTPGNFYPVRDLQREIADDWAADLSGASYVTDVNIDEGVPYSHPAANGSQTYTGRLRVSFSGTGGGHAARIRVAHTGQPQSDGFVPIDQPPSAWPIEWYETGTFTSGAGAYSATMPHPAVGFGVFVTAGKEAKAADAFAASTLRILSDDLAEALPEETANTSPEFMIGDTLYRYDQAEREGIAYYLTGVRKPAGAAGLDALAIEDGAEIEIGVYAFASSMQLLMRRILQSTGEALLRGVADVLPAGAGYGLPSNAIDAGSFDDLALPVEPKATNPIGESFADLFCGWLALNDRAIVLRDVDGAQKLAVVETAHGWPSESVADADLMTRSGFGVEVRPPEPTPTEIRVSYRDIYGAKGTITLRDTQRALYQRAQRVEYEAQGVGRDAVLSHVVLSAGPATFRRREGQAEATITVGPWIDAQPGDTIDLTIEHPSIYDQVSGSLAYTHTALVIGRRMRLTDCRVSLTVILQGVQRSISLCPGAIVEDKSGGTGAVPSTIDVNQRWFALMTQALERNGGSSFVVLHYVRGDSSDETTGNELTIDDVQETGGVCRLSVASGSNTVTIATDGTSVLTWPDEGGNGSAWQDAWFTHIDDGGEWS